jgi:hypothetical protein
MPTFCPVCGYDLALPDPDRHPDPCPCCAFRFKDFDDPKSYNYFAKENSRSIFVGVRRTTWCESHLPWCSKTIPRPDRWDPIVQLKNIGVNMGTSYEEWMDRNPIIIPENKDKFLKIARERIQKLGWRPQFIEALWDGDTQGWFLNIAVSAKRDDGTFDKAFLWCLRGGGGDFRLFAGTVPPYPEVAIGRHLLDEISKEYGIESYFPSEGTDDSYVYFWERDDTMRCRTCGKHIHIYAHSPTRDQCWPCEQRDKQAKKST